MGQGGFCPQTLLVLRSQARLRRSHLFLLPAILQSCRQRQHSFEELAWPRRVLYSSHCAARACTHRLNFSEVQIVAANQIAQSDSPPGLQYDLGPIGVCIAACSRFCSYNGRLKRWALLSMHCGCLRASQGLRLTSIQWNSMPNRFHVTHRAVCLHAQPTSVSGHHHDRNGADSRVN